MLRRPQMLPAHFNPGLATHSVRPQPMLTSRGKRIPDWVSAQRRPSALAAAAEELQVRQRDLPVGVLR